MKEALRTLALGRSLSEAQTYAAFCSMMDERSEVTDSQIGAFLLGTAIRPPTSEELVGGVRALRDHMVRVPIAPAQKLLDTCGTGGTGLDCFNTSTIAALVSAAAGQPTAKHGNRAATSTCGSADLLEALGVSLDLDARALAACCQETGFCFMFAPRHHPATKRVQIVRKQLPFRSIFNFLGPLSNPAGAVFQVVGVSELTLLPVIAKALSGLGVERALVVRGEDGVDELSLGAPTRVFEIAQGQISEYQVTPEQFGFHRVPVAEMPGGSVERSANTARSILKGERSPYRDLVVLNSAAGLYVSGRAPSIEAGIGLAERALDSGLAAKVLEQVVGFTQRQNEH
ncbi:MAG: anthranilate phosphoribosyltransferase [Bdellovibrionales bacterium]|nr:anthranilate phosphoribosyltransferase [Bdellovibrionales bacterium]